LARPAHESTRARAREREDRGGRKREGTQPARSKALDRQLHVARVRKNVIKHLRVSLSGKSHGGLWEGVYACSQSQPAAGRAEGRRRGGEASNLVTPRTRVCCPQPLPDTPYSGASPAALHAGGASDNSPRPPLPLRPPPSPSHPPPPLLLLHPPAAPRALQQRAQTRW
jgi:hypothetical protein